MRLHWLQHVPFEGLGSIADWAKERCCLVTSTKFYQVDSLPKLEGIDLLLLMGGPMGIYDENQFPWLKSEKSFIKEAIESGIKIVGICLGAQLLADCLGARVFQNDVKEIGWFPVNKTPTAESTIFGELLPSQFDAFHWHGETFDLPPRAVHLAESKACQNQSFLVDDRILGLQFHLEVTEKSVSSLIENCSHELIDAPGIQKAEEMLSLSAHFPSVNKLMGQCLNALCQTAG